MRRCVERSSRSHSHAPRVSLRARRGGATPVAGLRFRSRAALLVVRADHRPLSRWLAREQGRENGVVRRGRVAANNFDGDRGQIVYLRRSSRVDKRRMRAVTAKAARRVRSVTAAVRRMRPDELATLLGTDDPDLRTLVLQALQNRV